MPQSKIKLEDFLAEEKVNATTLFAIIEPDEQNKNNVSITPWINGTCNYSGRLSVPKKLIQSVEKTNYVYAACGKTHAVVRSAFFDNANILLKDLFSQLAKNYDYQSFIDEIADRVAQRVLQNRGSDIGKPYPYGNEIA